MVAAVAFEPARMRADAARMSTDAARICADAAWMRTKAARIRADAARLRAAGADFVVVSLHFGDEKVTEPSAYQRDVVEQVMRSRDVDLVIGHHAHVVQPIQRRRDGRWGVFGLGNLLAQQALMPGGDRAAAPGTARSCWSRSPRRPADTRCAGWATSRPSSMRRATSSGWPRRRPGSGPRGPWGHWALRRPTGRPTRIPGCAPFSPPPS